MNIIYFTKYTRKGASSRLRSHQYVPYLENEGFKVTVFPLFSDEYLDQIYNGKRSKLFAFKPYLKRIKHLFKISRKSKIIIEKELFPYLPAWTERFLNLIGIKYIVDYDDAIFHNYDKSPNPFIRLFLKNKIDVVMRKSKCVIVGNKYLKEKAIKAKAKCIEVIPTVIDLSLYKEQKHINEGNEFIIGWIGTPITFKRCLETITPALKKLIESGAEIHIIGAKGNLGISKNIHFIPWSEKNEIDYILKFDVGIMPLEDVYWERGKCSYKLIQYMACGLPVVASPIGMNTEVVEHGVNGYLANTQEEWINALLSYKKDKELRKKHGEVGFNKVAEQYTIKSQLSTLINVLIQK